MGRFLIIETPTGYFFQLRAVNGATIFQSGEYITKGQARRAVLCIQENASSSIEDQTSPHGRKRTNPKYEVFLDEGGKYSFRFRSRNGHIIAVSTGYTSKQNCLKGIRSVTCNALGSFQKGKTKSSGCF